MEAVKILIPKPPLKPTGSDFLGVETGRLKIFRVHHVIPCSQSMRQCLGNTEIETLCNYGNWWAEAREVSGNLYGRGRQ